MMMKLTLITRMDPVLGGKVHPVGVYIEDHGDDDGGGDDDDNDEDGVDLLQGWTQSGLSRFTLFSTSVACA